MFSAEHGANVASRVRGVLGEDFLRNFDILIDYRHRVMWLEPAPGSLAGSAIGEHLPLQFTASDRGELARTQPVIYGRIPEMGDAPISLLLDSGANQLTLLRDTLGPGEYQAEPILTGSFSRWVTSTATARRIRSLDLGSTVLSNLIVVGLARRTGVNWDGVLPTSLFHSVLISHFGRFAILNPSFPKESGDVLAAR